MTRPLDRGSFDHARLRYSCVGYFVPEESRGSEGLGWIDLVSEAGGQCPVGTGSGASAAGSDWEGPGLAAVEEETGPHALAASRLGVAGKRSAGLGSGHS